MNRITRYYEPGRGDTMPGDETAVEQAPAADDDTEDGEGGVVEPTNLAHVAIEAINSPDFLTHFEAIGKDITGTIKNYLDNRLAMEKEKGADKNKEEDRKNAASIANARHWRWIVIGTIVSKTILACFAFWIVATMAKEKALSSEISASAILGIIGSLFVARRTGP